MTREEILQEIADNLGEAVQHGLHSESGLGVLRELANDLDTPGVDVFLASMPGTPSRVLDLLMQRNNPEVIRLLAQTDELNRQLQFFLNGRDHAAAAGSVQFGNN